MSVATASMEQWRGKVALVTGASSGIGRAIVRALARDGMRVAFCARRQDRLDELTRELFDGEPSIPGSDILVRSVDLREEAQILDFFARIREKWGGVDVLVNNAGLGHSASLLSGSSEDWREMLELNVLALCIATREALSDMRARGDAGHVIHLGSMAGHRVPTGSGVYSASKFAVRALTEALRGELRELGSAIRVTELSPGYVETEFAEIYHGNPGAAEKTYGRFPVLQPEDLAAAVRYVLSQPPHVQVHDVLMRPTQQES